MEFTHAEYPCKLCQCTNSQDPDTGLKAVKCSPVPCDKNCSKVRLRFILPEVLLKLQNMIVCAFSRVTCLNLNLENAVASVYR